MLFKIAWRNIWRSKTRSIVVILSIAVGVWALSFVLSFSNGITQTFVQNAIKDQYSHIQLHHPKFPEDKNSKYFLGNKTETLEKIRQIPDIEAVTSRIISTGMVSSSRGARGVQIMGITPESEKAVTNFDKHLTDGEFFSEGKKNQILISERIAEKLKVKIRNRIVLTFQNMEGEITAAAFRIVGLFNTGNMLRDETLVYVLENDLKKNLIPENPEDSTIIYSENIANEIAIYLSEAGNIQQIKSDLKNNFSDALIEDYWELSPDVELYETQIDTSNSIIITIFMLALIFGIINTMLMAVLERYKELGMLMAIGMNKAKIFFMIVLETLMLAAVAAPIGLGIGFFTVYMLQDTGIDLSAFAKGLERFGMETTIFPVLDFPLYSRIATAVFITALLASIYPARKAIKLNPVEALHKI
ncbi:MAG: FtsX-like permease family protein [Bacteroidota bacterium]